MTQEKLNGMLLSLDDRGYPAYKKIRGNYRFPGFTLFIDHVQGDPFAAPSSLRVVVPRDTAGFPEDAYAGDSRRVALRDYLARRFSAAAGKVSEHRGTGQSGLISMPRPGQEILARSSVFVRDGEVEARFSVGLPARGRKILGLQAADMLCRAIPGLVEKALLYRTQDAEALNRHLEASEDADAARALLAARKLCAFVADGSILPRATGIDQRPLAADRAVPFQSPESLSVTLPLPHAGEVTGMGIPLGVTLIVGGGYHGKSTLLRAIERGVYNHIPGDGRALVVTDPTAFKVRAEDGRFIKKVDISAFVNNLPDGTDTTAFSTENASGSTSQAANIVEALAADARVLLLDEDTCATNFMIRDRRMQTLVQKRGEPITPFIDRVGELFDGRGVSSILVMGGSGDYFEAAHTVIQMDKYRPRNVTEEARRIAGAQEAKRLVEAEKPIQAFKLRVPDPKSIDASKGRHPAKIGAHGMDTLLFGVHKIDVSALAQLVDPGQLAAIGQAIYCARERFMRERLPMGELAQQVDAWLRDNSLDGMDSRKRGDYAAFRPQEFLAVLNRLRTLKIR